jgi:hypothetical protein
MYRTNPLGEAGIWACAQHRGMTPVDPIVQDIVAIIEEDNARRSEPAQEETP